MRLGGIESKFLMPVIAAAQIIGSSSVVLAQTPDQNP